MTTKRKEELLEKLAGIATETSVDIRILEVLSCVLGEIHTNDDTRPKYCTNCGHIMYFDPYCGQHICKHCDKKR